jgi:hypothetical protein
MLCARPAALVYNIEHGHAFDPYLYNITDEGLEPETPPSQHASVMYYVGGAMGMIASVIVCMIVCTVRGKIRQRDQIESKCFDRMECMEDCCCACCCNPCTQCMLLRHEKDSNPAGLEGYQLCNATGVPV